MGEYGLGAVAALSTRVGPRLWMLIYTAGLLLWT